MVTTSELKRLESLHNRRDKESKDIDNGKPNLFSIDWLIRQELNQEGPTDTNSLAERNLRNKRLELLFQSIDSDSDEKNDTYRETTPNESRAKKEEETMRDETSINYPTTFLKPHELTNDLEIDLMESSLFSNRHDHQLKDPNSVQHNSYDIVDSLTNSNSVKDNSLRSVGSPDSIPARDRAFGVISPRITHRHHRNQSTSLGTDTHSCKANLKPLKRFRSVSQCDLVFPNLNFKKPKR
ncbi:hypothetical protein KGF57_003775 [Candida theae]|uniref:Uncharacterized protein n=1 Tax=Candida theae TaxID=1198502 RepID=A0AAD5FXM4_9ASCO|nr:uncharacterized protein KGF57_003775 [Candida theae]KAI5954752.1 hypothetical protein KGF57_003775 [Candida theae]